MLINTSMFANNSSSTLAIIEMHILRLEFAFSVVENQKSILIELGNAYAAKNLQIELMQNDSFSKQHNVSKITLQSKINKTV